MYAKRKQNGIYIDYTAGTSGVAAGDIIIQGGTNGKLVGVADVPIPANGTGAIATYGVYNVVKGSSISFATGDSVYWDGAAHVATSVDTNHTRIGRAIAVADSTASTVLINLESGFATSGGGSSLTVPQSAIASLNDQSGGAAANKIEEIEEGATCDAVASLAAKINAILVALRAAGIINS